MHPVSPVIIEREVEETKFIKEGCADLPAVLDEKGGALTRWLLSPEEVQQVVKQGYIYVHQLNASQGVQPIWLGVDCPLVFTPEEPSEDGVLDADEISLGEE